MQLRFFDHGNGNTADTSKARSTSELSAGISDLTTIFKDALVNIKNFSQSANAKTSSV